MIDLEFLRGLIGAVDESGIDSLEISRGGTRIRISKTPPPAPVSASALPAAPAHLHMPPVHEVGIPRAGAAAPAAAPAEAAAPAAPVSNLVEIKSPMVGTFYRAPAPEAPPYAEVGSKVAKGQTLCILEAMKLMNELESDVAGTVTEIYLGNASPVQFGQDLFRIIPD